MAAVRVEVVQHCDEPGCDLGALQFTCPACGRHVTLYDEWRAWWAVALRQVTCDKCGAVHAVEDS